MNWMLVECPNMSTPTNSSNVFMELKTKRKRPTERANLVEQEDFYHFSIYEDLHQSKFLQPYHFQKKKDHILLDEDTGVKKKVISFREVLKDQKDLLDFLLDAYSTHENDLISNLYRRISNLLIDEHEEYLQLQRKKIQAQMSGIPRVLALSERENQRWQQLHRLVQDERHEFFHLLEKNASVVRERILRFVPFQVETFYLQWEKLIQEDVYRLYPRYYVHVAQLAIESNNTKSCMNMVADVTLKHVKEAIPDTTLFSKQGLVSIDDTLLDKTLTGCPLDGTKNRRKINPTRDVISEDILAQKLMEKEDCDVCLSASTMWTLFNNDTKSFGPEDTKKSTAWLIPMKIHPSGGHKKTKKKRIFLDKVLYTNKMSAREKMENFCTNQVMEFFYDQAGTKQEDRLCLPEEKSYHVWTLGDKKVLIRCKNKATSVKLPTTKSAQANAKKGTKGSVLSPAPTPACILIKVDYQELGLCERITLQDRRKWWLNAWLRGNAEIFVAVINPFSFAAEQEKKNQKQSPTETMSSPDNYSKKQVLRWEKHTLASIVYGTNQSNGNDSLFNSECFEPMESFRLVDRILSLAYELPVGDYLIEYGPLTNEIRILQASDPKSNMTSSTVDLYAILNQEDNSSTQGETIAAPLGYIAPKWIIPKGLMPQYALERIAYTFRTGTYCVTFARDGTCPRLAQQQPCIDIHLRPLMNPLDRKRPFIWKFLLFDQQLLKASSGIACWSLVPTKAGTTMSEKKRQPRESKPTTILPPFIFCQDPSRNPFTDQPCQAKASTKDKATTKCQLRHLTLHQVMERLADDYLRHERLKRRKSKKIHRQKQLLTSRIVI